MSRYGYIYLTTNMVNGTFYIGEKKGEFDSTYLGSGKIINRAIKKYGKENFKVTPIEYAKDKQELDILEKKYIAGGETNLR